MVGKVCYQQEAVMLIVQHHMIVQWSVRYSMRRLFILWRRLL
jgi:hypothetical protein